MRSTCRRQTIARTGERPVSQKPPFLGTLVLGLQANQGQHLIGYARVSTLDQSCDLQLDALRNAGCLRVFEETASGALRDRPQLAAALKAMQPDDTLVVWRLDRLARSLKQLLDTVEGIETHGMKFRSLTESIDTSTAGGKFIFQIMGALAEFERGLIRERTYAGFAAARARGRRGGRPPAPVVRGRGDGRILAG